MGSSGRTEQARDALCERVEELAGDGTGKRYELLACDGTGKRCELRTTPGRRQDSRDGPDKRIVSHLSASSHEVRCASLANDRQDE